MTEKKRCDWIRDWGYWNGYPCCNVGSVKRGKLMLCAVHFGISEDADRLAKQPALRRAWSAKVRQKRSQKP